MPTPTTADTILIDQIEQDIRAFAGDLCRYSTHGALKYWRDVDDLTEAQRDAVIQRFEDTTEFFVADIDLRGGLPVTAWVMAVLGVVGLVSVAVLGTVLRGLAEEHDRGL